MWIVATEDELSEAVAVKLIDQVSNCDRNFDFVRKGGFGYLKSKVDNLCQISRRPILMVTDLDKVDCPPHLVKEWFGQRKKPANFLFRVAVREIEAWLLADRDGLASFLNISVARIQRDPDAISDPKAYLLRLAEGAPSELRRDLLPPKGAAASQGLGYNARLKRFVDGDWSIERAAQSSDSLARARKAIARCAGEFAAIQ
jgi:hypothetical protein